MVIFQTNLILALIVIKYTNHIIKSNKYIIEGLQLFNVLGQKIIDSQGNSKKEITLDVSRFSEGFYFLKIKIKFDY